MGMFRMQPTPFAPYFPAYLEFEDEDFGPLPQPKSPSQPSGRDDGLPEQGQVGDNPYADAFFGFSNYDYQPISPLFASASPGALGVGPGPGPGPGAGQDVVAGGPQGLRVHSGAIDPCPGPGPGPGSGQGSPGASAVPGGAAFAAWHGGAGAAAAAGPAGATVPLGGAPAPVPVPAPAPSAGAPLSSVFAAHQSLHCTIPRSQLDPAAAATANLFDHSLNLDLSNNLRPTSRRRFPPIPHPAVAAALAKMEPDQSLQDDLAAQEAAARTWQPELEGPRVGDKTPIDAITAEYAKADPVYVAKTMALPQTYTHYRPVKGDGNCGWRAIGFCYFELLIQQGSPEVVQGEQLRLSQLNDYLVNSGGYDPDMFMDFVEETMQLFKDISDNIHSPDTAIAILTSLFNSDESMGLLYHLRLLAASWLKGNRDQYEAWCEVGIDGYCASMIEPPDREIEELGVVLLVEILLKPVGFILEIAYLDRSAGTEVNTHRFPESNNSLGPFMHLLYRPGHYDILYKPNPRDVQVNRMSFTPATFDGLPMFSAPFDYNPLAMIPGTGAVDDLPPLGQFGGGPMEFDTGPIDGLSPLGQLGGGPMEYAPTPQSPWFPSPLLDPSPTPAARTMSGACPYSTSPQIPTQSQPPPPSTAAPTTPPHSIRFSEYQYPQFHPTDVNIWSDNTFQTSTFKNSHFNKAHYKNPEFTPEEFKPGGGNFPEKPDRSNRERSNGMGSHDSSSDDSIPIKKEK